ncbi:CGNR zinc finger domain-containing protein [Nocardia sp. NPDC088792]|uniref:CGNR zinc finger domain-containing protein n=1 Tax=Nocardia sp. NPDC088792 TaxID=3364332 RepID=UPI0038306306
MAGNLGARLDDQIVDTLLRRYPAYPLLVQLPGRPWSMHSEPPPDADRTYWLLSTAALAFGLWLSGRCAWGQCDAPDCERFFIDTGRRQPQRFCGPRCATRSRVAAYRDRGAS